MNRILYVSLVLGLYLNLLCSCQNQLKVSDPELFKGSPNLKLARVCIDGDTQKLSKYLIDASVDLNYREPLYCLSALNFCVLNGKSVSSIKLLEHGADPNLHDCNKGNTPLTIACNGNYLQESRLRLVRELLNYGADANCRVFAENAVETSRHDTPLIIACSYSGKGCESDEFVEIVSELINHGASVNDTNRTGSFPLLECMVSGRYDLALVLVKAGADYKRLFYDGTKFSANGKKRFLIDVLHEAIPEKGSYKYKCKQDLINYLNSQGFDYYNYQIPTDVIENIKNAYPTGWEEYMKDY